MRHWSVSVVLLVSLLFGCGASQQSDTLGADPLSTEANAFNPWLNKKLPNLRPPSDSGSQMLNALGAKGQTIEGEASHRKNWREEIYPVVFGDKKSPNEIIVLLDYAAPQSEQIWNVVTQAAKSLKAADAKIVVFGHTPENYGTDLMGLTIWLAQQRPAYAMPWITYSLSRWNIARQAHNAAGTNKKFISEYDAVARPGDFPIAYSFLTQVKPPVAASQELAIAKYSYNAGNINMYQATQVCKFYGVSKLPAVIVNGHKLSNITAQNILDNLH